MNMFPSSLYMASEVARQRHADLVREADQWRLMKEVERAQPRRRFSLRAAAAQVTNLLPLRQPVSETRPAPC